MAGLSFRGVQKTYGTVRALRGLDLDVAEGELMVLVGPSGCGKTTALRTAAGLEQVTGGAIYIGSRDVTGLPPSRRNISMVFQSYALFPHLTLAENIGFGLAARRVPRAEIRRRVQTAAAVVGCEALLSRKPFQVSGGERQRAALARAMVGEPEVFLLDEPLSNLDAQLRVHMRAELKRLHLRLGATMVYVTHDQVEALTLGDRVAVLREGTLQQVGTPDEVYRRPANRFVGQFIGSPAMNVLPASLDGDWVRAGPFRLRASMWDGRLQGRPLELGVRPEHLIVAEEGGDGAPANVQVVEAAGNETFLHIGVGEQTLVARGGPELRPPLGATVHVTVRPDSAFLFDPDSGKTLDRAR